MASDHALARARLTAQGLAGAPARTVGEVAERLLAIQAQDQRGFRLAVRARSRGLTAADVDRALTDERSVVVSWLNRGTLHLVPAADYWWLHRLTTPSLAAGNRRRLGQEGVSPAQAERGVKVVMDAVRADGPQTRGQLGERLDRAKVPTARQALVHVLFAAALADDLVRGPVVGNEQAFVSAADWLGPPPQPLDEDEALGRLARRYLGGHAPATAEDLAQWAGITVGRARRGLAAAGTVPARRPAALPSPKLLGPFDPLLHGWASRRLFLGDAQGVVTSNGIFRPSALVDGRVVATWGLAGGVVTVSPFGRLTKAHTAALSEEAAAVLAFLGLPPRPPVIGPGPA